MKKFICFYIGLICLLCWWEVANAKNLYYARMSIGTGISNKLNQEDYGNKRMKNCKIFHLALGKKLTDQIELDLGVHFVDRQVFKNSGVDVDGLDVLEFSNRQKFTSKAYMLSGSYDFNISSMIKPYVSLGIGISENKAGDYVVYNIATQTGKKTTDSALTVAGGIKYHTERFETFLEYRHLNLGKVTTTNRVNLVVGSETTVDDPIKTRLRYNIISLGFNILF